MITLCNYASYQDRRTTTEQQRNNNGTTTEHIQELKEYKEDNSTPPKIWLYSHNGFFDRQIARNSKAPEIESYKRLVEYLHGKNPDELRFDNVLSISKQISYKDFVSLKETARATGRTIKEVLTAMENTAGLKKKYKNVYLTAKNWLQMEFKK